MELRDRLAQALGDAYQIDRELPPGGMSRLFLATERSLDRTVVVKLLPPEFSSDVSVARFRREIELSAKLQHPHILPLLSMGTAADGLLYYIMPYVPGESLRTRLGRSGALPVDEALRMLLEMTDAVAHAHRHGVVHRDIKPENVLLQHDHAVLTDFGIARAFSEARVGERITGTGLSVGTLGYMAPEQLAGEPLIDERADVYALGVVGHEMLAGKPPFDEPEARALAAAHLVTPPPALPEIRPEVSAAVALVIGQALAKDPESRWKSAGEMRDALRAAIDAPRRGWRPSRRMAIAGAAIVAVAAALAIGRGANDGAQPVVSHDLIAVLPFRVAGSDPSLAMLREGMVDLIAAKLSGDRGPHAVDPRAALSAWRREVSDPSSDLSVADAIAMSRDLGAGRVILGSVIGAPSRITITATLRGTGGSATAVSAEVSGPLDSLPVHVERLIAGLLAREAGERDPNLTMSLPALQSYLSGMQAQRAGRYLQAAEDFEAALDADSNFVRAAHGLFEAGQWLVVTEGRRFSERATATIFRLQPTLSSRQRLELDPIVGSRYPLPSTFRDAIDGLERAIAGGVNRPEVWYPVADLRYHWGPIMGLPDYAELAEQHFRKAVSLDSGYVPALEHLAEIAWERGDTAEANRFARAYLRDTTAFHHHYVRWRLALVTGDSAELRRVRAQMSSAEDGSLMRIMGSAVYEQLPMADADLAADALADRLRGNARGRQPVVVAYSSYLMIRGQPTAAARAWRSLGDPRGPVNLFPVSAALFASGDTGLARETLDDSRPRLAQPWSDDARQRGGRLNLLCAHALWAYRARDMATFQRLRTEIAAAPVVNDLTVPAHFHWPQCLTAVNALTAVDARRPDARALVDRLDSLARHINGDFVMPNYSPLVTFLYERLGVNDRALASARRWPHHQHGTLIHHPADRLQEEGRLRAAIGDTTGAIRAYQHYLFLRGDAEPSVQPEVDRVRGEVARLQRTRS